MQLCRESPAVGSSIRARVLYAHRVIARAPRVRMRMHVTRGSPRLCILERHKLFKLTN